MKYFASLLLLCLCACSKTEVEPTPNPDFYDVRLVSDARIYPYLVEWTIGDSTYSDSLYAEKASGDGLDTTITHVPAETFIKIKASSDIHGNAMKIRIIYGQDKGKAILYPTNPVVELSMTLP